MIVVVLMFIMTQIYMGCDSTFILNLIVNQSNDSYTPITSCG